MRKKIIILYPISFPIGGAATNRIIQICKALNLEGNIVKLYITRPTENKNNVRTTRKGIYEGIEFYYVNKNIVWPKKLIKKVICMFTGLINTSIILAKEDYDVVLSYGDFSFLNHFVYLFFVKVRWKKIVYAIDEYPWTIIYKTNSILNRLYLKLFYKMFDALLVMTFTLLEYYSTKIRKGAMMHHLPMTVEIERFNIKVTENIKDPTYIAYCGYDIFYKNGLIFSKDGVDILINAFSTISQKYKKTLLYIIGESKKYHYQLVEELKLKEKIVFIGNLSPTEIPKYLCNAKLLVLARPNNIQAQGAFPSKLGEYLATGNPVVVTKVGEIPIYLKDNWNAFLAEPGDIQSFAERMHFALSNPEIAKEVGTRGKELAEKEFDYKKQGIKLNEFITRLLNS